MEDWYAQLAEEPAVLVKARKKMALIIPYYNEEEMLLRHLGALDRQTFREFDVILVLSPVSSQGEIIKKISGHPFGIVVVKRKHDTGSAGGFYLGEKQALERGFETVVFADVDALPLDDDLLEAMWGEYKKGADLVTPRRKLYIGEEITSDIWMGSLHHYGFASVRLLRKAGLHFAPLYLGADDPEHQIRLMKFAEVKRIGQSVTHPAHEFGFRDFGRSVSYVINHMLLTIPSRWMYYLYICSLVVPALLAFGKKDQRRAAAEIIRSVAFHRYGKEAYGFRTGEAQHSREVNFGEFDVAVSPTRKLGGENTLLHLHATGTDFAAKIRNVLKISGGVFRKRALLVQVNLLAIVQSLILSRETWVLRRGMKAYLAGSNGPVPLHLLRLLLFAILVPGFFTLGVLTLALNLARKPETLGYGLR